jgi:pimeloyl-ACP methyl ester carboxylesterase
MIFEYSGTEKINYEITGNGKTSLLFLHGFGASLETWKFVKDFFDKEKYTLIFVDLCAHGNSSYEKQSDYSIEHQTKIIFEFIKKLKLDDFILIGHSYGGSIALLLSVIYPELKINKMILIDAGAYSDELPFFIRQLKNPLISFLSNLLGYIVPKKAAGRFVLKNLYYNKKLATDERVSLYTKFFSVKQFKTIIKAAKGIIPAEYDTYISSYSKINIPVLIIWGKDDGVISLRMGEKLHKSLKNSNLVVLPNCGHIPQEELPEETYEKIAQFL